MSIRRLSRWLWTRRRWQEYTKALQDEVDSLRVHVEYQRTRSLVAVSLMTSEQYDEFREHVDGIDEMERNRVRCGSGESLRTDGKTGTPCKTRGSA